MPNTCAVYTYIVVCCGGAVCCRLFPCVLWETSQQVTAVPWDASPVIIASCILALHRNNDSSSNGSGSVLSHQLGPCATTRRAYTHCRTVLYHIVCSGRPLGVHVCPATNLAPCTAAALHAALCAQHQLNCNSWGTWGPCLATNLVPSATRRLHLPQGRLHLLLACTTSPQHPLRQRSPHHQQGAPASFCCCQLALPPWHSRPLRSAPPAKPLVPIAYGL